MRVAWKTIHGTALLFLAVVAVFFYVGVELTEFLILKLKLGSIFNFVFRNAVVSSDFVP